MAARRATGKASIQPIDVVGETDLLADSTGGPPLWTCPRCGHRFVTANLWHSCSRYSLDQAFARSTPAARAAFDRFVELMEGCGPVAVIVQKTRIVLMARVRFAGAVVRRDHVVANIALTRAAPHPRWSSIEEIVPGWFAHRFPLREPADLAADPALLALFCESYRDLGEQRAKRRAR